nr:hypothetical protein [Thiothrix fructosivorans]
MAQRPLSLIIGQGKPRVVKDSENGIPIIDELFRQCRRLVMGRYGMDQA